MLYCITSNGSIKIGYTEDLRTFSKRLQLYRTHNPNFSIVGIIEGTRKDEQEWHKKLKIVDTEWASNVDSSILEYFKSNSLIKFEVIGEQLITELANLYIAKDKKITKTKNKEEHIKEVTNEINAYLLDTLDLSKDYMSDELKDLVGEINFKWDLALPRRPASVGKFIGIKKCSVRIPKLNKIKTVYRIVSKTPGYEYVRSK